MKKYLFIALAALGFAACSEKFDETKSPSHNGEVEESYIAINLMAADADSRANEAGFEYGTDKERKIETAYFFFFDENGNPFNVVGNPEANAPGGNKNYLQLTLGNNIGSEGDNVSDVREAVLILNTYKGIHPKQVIAVLNWVPQENTYTIDKLHEAITNIVNVNGSYVMSNSVYMDSSNKLVDAVAISEDNIKKDAGAAKANPIDIYVERIAAKVVLTANGEKVSSNTHDNVFDTKKQPDMFIALGDLLATPVYVQLLGWELFNDYSSSYILKNIDTTWGDTLGFNWNDYFNFRSYWAISQKDALTDEFNWEYTAAKQEEKGYKTAYGFNVASNTNYTDETTYTYCGENTYNTDRTQVILKGKLLQSNGTGGHKTLELASWYGNDYAGTDNLLTAVANSLAYTLFHSDDGVHFTPIQKEDIECSEKVAGTKSYETGFVLSSVGKEKKWYEYSSDENHKPVAGDVAATKEQIVAATNQYLADHVKPAVVYVDGMTYYFVDVEHVGSGDAKCGIVRNHVYQIDINSIKGYGSPIYSGKDFIVDQPEYPEEYDETYVAARIKVLSWKIVKQTVDIVQ